MDNDSEISIKDWEVFLDKGVEKDPRNGKAVQYLQRMSDEVKKILDHNRMLIQEIGQNHESRESGSLNRNSDLICELHNNMDYVANLYAELSSSFSRSVVEGSPIVVDGPSGG